MEGVAADDVDDGVDDADLGGGDDEAEGEGEGEGDDEPVVSSEEQPAITAVAAVARPVNSSGRRGTIRGALMGSSFRVGGEVPATPLSL